MDNISFRPVRGTEEKIVGQTSYHDGYLYFATDTGKIFLDTLNERIAIGGGGAAILYAFAQDITENLNDFTYNIQFSDLEDSNANPKAGDLIINQDGRFFKVSRYDAASGIIRATLIAVSGTGGGGGGDIGGGDTGTTTGVTLRCVGTAPNAMTFIHGQSQKVYFKAEATADDIVNYSFTVTSAIDSSKTNTTPISAFSGDTVEFDLGAVLYEGSNTLVVNAVGANSGSARLNYSGITAIVMALKPSQNFNALKYAYNDDLTFYCIPVGTISKTLKVYIDGNLVVSENYLPSISEQQVGVTIPKQEHGTHQLKAELVYSTGVTEIATAPLEYEVAFVDQNNNAPVIWLESVPNEITNHDKLTLRYMVYDQENPSRTTVRRYVNGVEIASLDNVAYSDTNWIPWNIPNYKVGKNTFNIQCGTSSREIVINVLEDELRDLDVITAGLYLNLSSVGRSNSENPTSRQTWEYARASGETTRVQFNDFNWYNNGWINDSTTGDSVLRISNGASINVPLSVMNTTKLSSNLTFEVQFKLRNVQKYENLIEITSEEIKVGEETEIKVTKKVKSTEGVWGSYYNNNIGMCLGTQEGFFKSSQSIASGRYKEEDIITASFVIEAPSDTNQYPLIYMYINGVMSSIINYDKTTDAFNSNCQMLTINSNYCDVDVYKIRVYTSALSSIDIVHNYIADLNDANLYDMNQIVEFKNNIPSVSYSKIVEYNLAHPDSLLQPYAVLECVDTNEDLLPYVKGGKKYLNVTFVNPALDAAWEAGEITGERYIQGCPSFIAKNIEFDVQGTSSQGYPRRNYKGKFKKKDNNSWVYSNGPLAGLEIGSKNTYKDTDYKGYYMDNAYSETTFTWKADYMESSMTHNTGFASFVSTLYSHHPLEDYSSTIDVTDRRTTVYGFPMIVFQKKADGTYEFIGRYNYNLDKGCNNVIGFEDETPHPFVEGTFIEDGKEKPLDFAHVAECWELLNNQGSRTAFTYTNFAETNEEGKLAVLNDFEYRYNFDEDNIDNALDKKGDFASMDQAEINTFLLTKYANLEKLAEWLKSTDTSAATNDVLPATVIYGNKEYNIDSEEYRLAKFANEFNKHFNQEYCTVYFIMTEFLLQYDSRGKNMMLASWGPQELGGEYIWYPIFYDIDTQLGVNNSGVPSWEYYNEPSPVDGEGLYSTANSVLWVNFEKCFLDTIKTYYQELRLNNLTYVKLKGYYDYDPNVSNSYAMRGNRPVNIINVDQYWKYIAPTFTGYINTSGTISKDEGKRFYCLQGDRALHRELFLRNRFNFMDSKWLGGSYAIVGAKQEFQIRCNANYAELTSDKYLNRTLTADDTGYVQATYPQALDADLRFSITPYLHQYNSLWFDETMMTYPQRWDGENPNLMSLTSDKQNAVETYKNLTQQLFYIGGAEYISSLGDLSLKYPDEIYLTALKRLKDVRLGNDDPAYKNNALTTFILGAGALDAEGKPNENTKSLLEQVVLSNVGTLSGSIDVTGAEKLKEFRALGTNITGVNFADGGQMEIIHLPNTIKLFTLTEPVSLQNLLTGPNKDNDGKYLSGLYIQGLTEAKDSLANETLINTLSVIGGNMGYDSCSLTQNYVTIKQTMQNNPDLDLNTYSPYCQISMEDVLWTPYKLVEYGTAMDTTKTYKKKTENSTFEDYTASAATWTEDTLNELVYEVLPDSLDQLDVLTDTSLLDTFLNDYIPAKEQYDTSKDQSIDGVGTYTGNYFKDVTEYADGRPTYPYLTGDIFINNPSTTPISEFQIKNYYNKYYPELNIFVANVDPAYTAKFVEITDEGKVNVLDTLKYEREENISPTMSSVIPSRLHHDFKGWSRSRNPDITNADGTLNEEKLAAAVLTEDEFATLKFSENESTMTFYAVFYITSYPIYFYDMAPNSGDVYEEIVYIPYGSTLYDPVKIPYRGVQEQSLDYDKRLTFKGWTNDSDLGGVVTQNQLAERIINLNDYVSNNIYKFYALFVEEDVWQSVTDYKYFTINSDDSGNTSIIINPDYYGALRGKITLPTVTATGTPITIIGQSGFNALKCPEITHIFFDRNNDNQYNRIGSQAFESHITNNDGDFYSNQLKYFDIDDMVSLEVIGQFAFRYCDYLDLQTFGPNIKTLENQILNQSMGLSGTAKNLVISGSLTTMVEGAIENCDIPFESLTLGGPGDPSNLTASWTPGVNNPLIRQNADSGTVYGDCRLKKVTIYCTADREAEFNTWMQDFAQGDGYSIFQLREDGNYDIIITAKGE